MSKSWSQLSPFALYKPSLYHWPFRGYIVAATGLRGAGQDVILGSEMHSSRRGTDRQDRNWLITDP